MTLEIYAIKDVKLEFSNPFFQPNQAVAIRNYGDLINRTEPNQFNEFPEDKELWKIGEYDTKTGMIKPQEPAFVVKAKDLLKPQENKQNG